MAAPINPVVCGRWAAEVAARRLQFDGAQHAAAQRLDALREKLLAPPPTLLGRLLARTAAPRGLYLWGGVGRGKTLLVDLFFASLQDASDSPPTAQRSHFHHFMRDVHARLGRIKQRAQPLDLVAQQLAARSRVICLDEFFVADIGDAMILAGLFDGLFRRGVTLVATSNLAPQDLYKDGLQRQRFLPAIELIAAHVDVLHLDGGIDYRLRQLEQAPTYLDSAQPGSAAALQERFAALAGAAAGGPATLEIEGRKLSAVKLGHGTVWFEFGELCEGPRSQNDYIELARVYGTLFISEVPVFTPAAEDAARRFIMLIDELYDRGVKTVVSAAGAPDRLYRGERLHAEFARTASRLIEMQTPAYLAGRHHA